MLLKIVFCLLQHQVGTSHAWRSQLTSIPTAMLQLPANTSKHHHNHLCRHALPPSRQDHPEDHQGKQLQAGSSSQPAPVAGLSRRSPRKAPLNPGARSQPAIVPEPSRSPRKLTPKKKLRELKMCLIWECNATPFAFLLKQTYGSSFLIQLFYSYVN